MIKTYKIGYILEELEMKVYVVYKYDSIFDDTAVDKIFVDKQKAIDYMKQKNYTEYIPEEFELIN